MDWGGGMRFCISLLCAGFIVCGALAADETTTSFLAGGNVANQNLNTDEYKATAELQMELINSELDEIAELIYIIKCNPSHKWSNFMRIGHGWQPKRSIGTKIV